METTMTDVETCRLLLMVVQRHGSKATARGRTSVPYETYTREPPA